MSVENTVLGIVTSIFQVLIMWQSIRIFLVPKIEKIKEAIGYVLYYVVTVVIFLKFQYPLYTILANWIGLLLLTGGYKGSVKKKVLIATLVYSIGMVIEILVAFIFYNYAIGDTTSQVASIFTTLICYCIKIIVEKIVKNKEKCDVSFPWLCLLVVPIVSCINLYFLVAANLNNRSF